MNYAEPITTTVVPRGMSQQHEFAARTGAGKRVRRPSPTLFLVVMRALRRLAQEKAKGKPAVVPARLRKAADSASQGAAAGGA